MLSDALLDALMCPVCGGRPLGLVIEETDEELILVGTLACPDCKRWFTVRDDIPRMMPPDLASNLVSADDHWEGWTEAMHRFLRWREAAWGDAAEAAQRRETALAMHRRFVDFCALPAGPLVLLDVGCGTGHAIDLLPDDVTYIGIDPLPAGASPWGFVPERMPRPERPPSLVQGVGESLPFADDSFDAVLLMGTLDHCRSPEEMLGQVARVLRPGGTLDVLQGLSARRDDGASGGVLRSLIRSLTGQQSPSARDTHLRSYASTEDVAALLAGWFEVQESAEDSGRAFVRATAPGGEG